MLNIELKVIEGKNLKGADFGGLSSDPYCKIITRQCTQQTQTCNMTRNPHWNRSFNMQVAVGEDIRFECYDYDNLGKNDSLGKTHYKVIQGFPGQVIDTWLGLDKKGEIHIQIIHRGGAPGMAPGMCPGMAPGMAPGMYPPPMGAYPPPMGGAYPPPMGAYPPPMGAYPPPMGGYPPQAGAYPPMYPPPGYY
ncbi:hypothetical protein EIN_057320 [Entamoeba invadens IP1]|uniref:hypothetical protein n=1 Tax=Entamoeba invadens IP1 TaxID=370355 RepID=UPI0002C3DD48|nr:hypothetical protein EIN_057320 [Entamoeba invadens IP1]ELP93347.1 hypothetical protein EIN_057320 [Entamoeba invadens IP1]|eukprot:XP_004260118.1 hypothetical protein EIN_057320 [Entamoeba invadens IP1]